ncbi:hypothetical protein CSB86_3494 [Pseudomonas aeruginosa]|nr:hypothetical protein CSB86_3494 [Pseudomonas aeruginosa]
MKASRVNDEVGRASVAMANDPLCCFLIEPNREFISDVCQ